MTVEELIAELKRMPDPRQEVKVQITDNAFGAEPRFVGIERVQPENTRRFGTKIILQQ